jgi:hypothetical protein
LKKWQGELSMERGKVVAEKKGEIKGLEKQIGWRNKGGGENKERKRMGREIF